MNRLINAITLKGLPARDIKNANLANLWIFAWAGTLAIISFLSKYDWYASVLPTTIGIVVHVGIGVGMMLAYKRLLKHLDEMERKIQLESMALSVGMTLVGFSTYSILDKAGFVPELKPAFLIMLMGFTYIGGLIIGRIRYR